MKFHRARIASRDTKTYEVVVEFEHSGKQSETAKFLSPSVSSVTGGGFFTLPPVGSTCLVLEDTFNDYWVLGYYNVTNPGSTNGWLLDSRYPRPVIGDGDTLLRHHSGGNYLLLTSEKLTAYQGINTSLSLTGGQSSTFELLALRMNLNISSGYMSWYTEPGKPDQDNPSKFEWVIQKNFEQSRSTNPSDFTFIRSGTIEGSNQIFDLSTTQYVAGTTDVSAETYLSLSRDNDDNLVTLRVTDIDNEGNSSYTINRGYWHNLTVKDANRTVTVDIMPDTNVNLKINLNDSVVITGKDDGTLELKGNENVYFTSPKVNLGSKSGAEPLALGDSLMGKLNELIQAYNSHIHPTPAGPSSPPPQPFTAYKTTDFLSKVSKSD